MSHRFPFLPCALLFSLVIADASRDGGARAATITVGNGGCQYIGLQFALDELESQPGPHVIKLKAQTIAVPEGLVLDTANTDYTFNGGYVNCSDASPTAGQRTTLDASGGSDGTAFAINGTSSSATPTIRFRNITITGGNSETGPFANPEGGGMEIRGRVFVALEQQSEVQENSSGRGAGVYLRGDNASERAILQLRDDSLIAFNDASSTGGGVHCEDFGSVLLDGGQISANTSASSGGGVALRNACILDSIVQGGVFTGLVGNQAGGTGGAISKNGSGSLPIRGSANYPFWLLGNSATEGGAISMGASGPTRSGLTLRSVVIKDNLASARLGGALTVLGPVDVLMEPAAGATSCAYLGVGYGACSAVIGNRHTTRITDLGGIIQLGGDIDGGDDALSPSLIVRRTLLQGNEGRHVLASWYGDAGIMLEGVAIVGNTLNTYSNTGDFPTAVIQVGRDDGTPPTTTAIRHSTITGNTPDGTGGHLVDHHASPLDLTGTILHNPGTVVRTGDSSGAVSFGGCLITHQAGAFAGSPIVADPQLAADLTPASTSPALDRCGTSGAPTVDFRGQARVVDQPGIVNGAGALDIGAIERAADPASSGPDLRVLGNGLLIADGSIGTSAGNHTDFGAIRLEQASVTRTYALYNIGDATLNISGHAVSGACSDDFQVLTISSSIAPGASGVANVRFDPQVAGECLVTYQILSNDPGNSPYDFRLRGVGLPNVLFANGFE